MNTQCQPQAYHALLSAGRGRWIPPLMQLLHRYEGIERALEPEQLPLLYLDERLSRISQQPLKNREQVFFDVVTSLSLLYYRASSKISNWHPWNKTFLEFERRFGTVFIWQAWTPQVSKQDIVKWMLANLVESHHVWHSA